MMSFMFTTICLTSMAFSIGWFMDLLQIFSLPNFYMTVMFKFIELFPFMSSFFTAFKCFRIMEARGAELTRADILKIIVRKFVRLAPAYYICWLLVYLYTSRFVTGPVSYNALDKNMIDCSANWIYVATMTSNFFGTSMDVPMMGCYQ